MARGYLRTQFCSKALASESPQQQRTCAVRSLAFGASPAWSFPWTSSAMFP